MNTRLIKVNINNIEQDEIDTAALIIKNGGIVAFPTETVYGLGADAMNEKAVADIFAAKGRPADNPLIIHISDYNDIKEYAQNIPDTVKILADVFWPGPLTMILHKRPEVPYIVSGGLDTIALRIPSHPVARMLIEASGCGLAAPSANISGRPSPTAPEHVVKDLSGRVDAVIIADTADIGIESTVIDLTVNPPAVLRPGGITAEQLKKFIPELTGSELPKHDNGTKFSPKSPGMKYRHYSPDASVVLVTGRIDDVKARIQSLIDDNNKNGLNCGVIASDQTQAYYMNAEIASRGSMDRPEEYASRLFSCLRYLDEKETDVIFAEGVEDSGIGHAVMNRLKKAASQIITVNREV